MIEEILMFLIDFITFMPWSTKRKNAKRRRDQKRTEEAN